MKKLIIFMISAVLMLTVISPHVRAETGPRSAAIVISDPREPDKIKVLFARLEEIKAMDKSDMKSSEKKELRKEVRAIKSELARNGGGVYLSLGAIIIIVLLLVILL